MSEHHDVRDDESLFNFIMQRRIYDVLCAMYKNQDEAGFMELMALHDAGLFLGPEASISYGEDNEISDTQVP